MRVGNICFPFKKERGVAAALSACGAFWLVAAHLPENPPEAYSEDWSQRDLSWLGDRDAYAESRAICAEVRDLAPPPADLPDARDRVALAGCSSEALYYGIGGPADPVAARKCAYLEIDRNVAEARESHATPFEFFDANGMLAMIYANGKGAERNPDFAIHAACQLQDAPAAMDSRIRHLDQLRRGGPDAEEFSTCDDITSGIGMGICMAHNARLMEYERATRLARWQAGWTPRQRDLFVSAYDSLLAYAEVSHELDCLGGSMSAACSIAGTQDDIEIFLDRLDALLARNPVPPTVPPEEGDVLAGDFTRPATMTREEFDTLTEGLDEYTLDRHRKNLREAIAARRIFEPRLIAFLQEMRPDLSAHQVRVIFRDL